MRLIVLCRGILFFCFVLHAIGSLANEEIIDIDDPLAEKSSTDVDLGGGSTKPNSSTEESDGDKEAPEAPEIFEASEQVSEDLSVSFPADI